jgi:hypothetical protein
MDYNYSKYLGIPWVKGGRTMQGCDCYGLCMLISKEQFGIELPEINYSSTEESYVDGMVTDNSNLFEKLDKPESSIINEQVCLVTISILPPFIHHIGILLHDGLRFFHVRDNHRATITKLNDQLWSSMIKGYYRIKV